MNDDNNLHDQDDRIEPAEPDATAAEAGDPRLWEVPPQEEAAEPMTLLQCLAGVFLSPAKTFRSLTVKPHLLWPLAIILLGTVLTTFLSMGAMEAFTRFSMEAALARNPQALTPEMVEAQVQMSMKAILIMTPFMALLTPLLKGLVTHGMARLFDGKGKMKATLSVIALAYMVMMAGALIRLPLMMLSNTIITFSPALFLGPDMLGSAWSSFLMNFDLFTLWYLGVSAIGIREVHRISTGKAAVAVLVPFGLILLMSLSGVFLEKMMG